MTDEPQQIEVLPYPEKLLDINFDISEFEKRIMAGLGIPEQFLRVSRCKAPLYTVSSGHGIFKCALSMRNKENASPGYLRYWLKKFLGWSNRKVKRTRPADQKAVWRNHTDRRIEFFKRRRYQEVYMGVDYGAVPDMQKTVTGRFKHGSRFEILSIRGKDGGEP